MTASKHVGKLLLIVLGVLLSVPSVTAEQRERTRSNSSASASKSEKQSPETKQSSSKKTQGSVFERLQQLFKEAKESGRQSKPHVEVEEKGDTIVFKHHTPFGIRDMDQEACPVDVPGAEISARAIKPSKLQASRTNSRSLLRKQPRIALEPQQSDSTGDQR